MILSSVPAVSPAPVAPTATGKDAFAVLAPRIDTESLRKAVAAVRAALKPVAASLEFSVDEASGRAVVRVVDTETQQVIRQIPSKEMLEISRALERLQGLLLNGRA